MSIAYKKIDKIMSFGKYVMDENEIENSETVFVSEKYLVEIISGFKLMNDQSILSFKRMFDYQVYIIYNVYGTIMAQFFVVIYW